MKVKRKWLVQTHLGDFETWAVSEKKAIANVRFRVFGGSFGCDTSCWRAYPKD